MFDTLGIPAETSAVPIRRLRRSDADLAAAFVAGLDPATLYHRFGRFMPGPAIAAHYAGLDWDGAWLLACGNEAELGGIVEVYPYDTPAPERPGEIEAEIATVVARSWRGRGVGRLLLACGVAAAARSGAVRSTILLVPGDHALSGLARRFGFTIDAEGERAVLDHRCADGRV